MSRFELKSAYMEAAFELTDNVAVRVAFLQQLSTALQHQQIKDHDQSDPLFPSARRIWRQALTKPDGEVRRAAIEAMRRWAADNLQLVENTEAGKMLAQDLLGVARRAYSDDHSETRLSATTLAWTIGTMTKIEELRTSAFTIIHSCTHNTDTKTIDLPMRRHVQGLYGVIINGTPNRVDSELVVAVARVAADQAEHPDVVTLAKQNLQLIKANRPDLAAAVPQAAAALNMAPPSLTACTLALRTLLPPARQPGATGQQKRNRHKWLPSVFKS